LLWGAGHLAIGDRRGWLLVALQPLAIAAVAVLVLQLVDGTRWLFVFPPLVALLVIWLGQALHARRQAIERGAAPGDELQVAFFLPLAVTVLTVYWLIGGRHGSPPATLQAYIESWMAERPEAARAHFAQPPESQRLAAEWSVQETLITDMITRSRAVHGPSSGLDPQNPFDSLRFRPVAADGSAAPERAGFVGELVRSQRVETTLLGFIPTASQETVAVEPVVTIWLRLAPQVPPAQLTFLQLESPTWLIEKVDWST
jgi:hypothetical protein